jgi:hypothetical protein
MAKRFLYGMTGLMLAVTFFCGCNKKSDPKVTLAGGGASSQSVLTLKGAGQ